MNHQTTNITYREQEVLQLISMEYTIKEIAKLLFISPYTVIDHRNSLCKKLGAKKMAGLVRKGFETGVLTPNQVAQSTAN